MEYYCYKKVELCQNIEELNYEKGLNQNHFDDIKYNEDEPEEWNFMWQKGYFTYPYDEFRGVNAEMELAIERQFQLIKQQTRIMFGEKKSEITEYMFITINPDPSLNISVKALYDKLCKTCKSIRILDYIFTLEQRGENESECGIKPHMHLLIKHKFPKMCKLKDHLRNNFKQIVGNDKHIDIRCCKNIQDVINRYNYIKGNKIDESKMKKVHIDRIWRQRWNIQDTYGNMEEPQSEAS